MKTESVPQIEIEGSIALQWRLPEGADMAALVPATSKAVACACRAACASLNLGRGGAQRLYVYAPVAKFTARPAGTPYWPELLKCRANWLLSDLGPLVDRRADAEALLNETRAHLETLFEAACRVIGARIGAYHAYCAITAELTEDSLAALAELEAGAAAYERAGRAFARRGDTPAVEVA